MKDTIEHVGMVESVDGMHIKVRIIQTSACATCVAKGHCNASESKEKIIDVFTSESSNYKPGETVKLFGSTSMGMQAVLWAFGVPFLVMLVLLVVCQYVFGLNDLYSGLCALLGLVPYYVILYVLRDKFANKFSFKIKPIIN